MVVLKNFFFHAVQPVAMDGSQGPERRFDERSYGGRSVSERERTRAVNHTIHTYIQFR